MADYPIPPWLNPQTDWGGLALRRSQVQAQIAESGQRLAQEAVQFDQRMEMQKMAMEAEQKAKEQQLTMQSEIAKHRIAVEQAYQNTKLSMEAQQLKEQQRKVDLDYAKAARDFAGQQEFEDTLTENLKTKTPKEAFEDAIYRKGVQAGVPASAFSAIRKSEQDEDVVPKDFTTPGGARGVMGGGRWQILPPEAKTGDVSINREGEYDIINIPGKTPQVRRAMPFKFSKEKELESLQKNPSLAPYLSGVKKPTPFVKQQLDKLAALIALRDEEMAAYQGGAKTTGTSTNRFRYNPSSKSLIK